MFGHLKHQRRIATRYNKTALFFDSFLNFAAICRWLPYFVSRTEDDVTLIAAAQTDSLN